MKKFLIIVLCTLTLFSASAQSLNDKRLKELKKEIRHVSRTEDSSLKNRFLKEKELRLQIKKLVKEKEYAQAESLKLQIIDLYYTDATTNSEKKVAIDDSSSKSSNFRYETGDSLQNNVAPYRTIKTYNVNRSGFFFEGFSGLSIASYESEVNHIWGYSFGRISYFKNLTSRNRLGFITRSNIQIRVPNEELNIDILQLGPYLTISNNDKSAFEFGLVTGLTLKPYTELKDFEVLNLTSLFRFRKKYFGIGLDLEYNLHKMDVYEIETITNNYILGSKFVRYFNFGIHLGFRF
ncbi:MAG: hypothetical protein IPO21_16755 [Bacteroidales bacterium]|nr:hypothetical protein [Bacteroidales bacterium]